MKKKNINIKTLAKILNKYHKVKIVCKNKKCYCITTPFVFKDSSRFFVYLKRNKNNKWILTDDKFIFINLIKFDDIGTIDRNKIKKICSLNKIFTSNKGELNKKIYNIEYAPQSILAFIRTVVEIMSIVENKNLKVVKL